MKCQNCEQEIILKRTWTNLFSFPVYFLCEKCYQKYPIKLNFHSFFYGLKRVNCFSVFEERHYINLDCYIFEISKYLFFIIKKLDAKNDSFVYLNEYDDIIDSLEIVSLLTEGDIYFLTYF